MIMIGGGGSRIPVLLYHAVCDDPAAWIAPYTVSPKRFREQLDEIRECGRTVVPASRLAAALAGGTPLPQPALVITLDDGFADLPGPTAEALATRGLAATAYLTTEPIRRRSSLLPDAEMMTVPQICELESAGVEIGAHGATHRWLDTAARRDVERELREPKAFLQDTVGHPVTGFAYPHGYSSPAVRRAVVAAGYTSAYAVRNAMSSTGDDILRISRLMVRRDTAPQRFSAWIDGLGAPVAPFRDLPTTIGWRWYRRARSVVGHGAVWERANRDGPRRADRPEAACRACARTARAARGGRRPPLKK